MDGAGSLTAFQKAAHPVINSAAAASLRLARAAAINITGLQATDTGNLRT
jgi:hypothetical protein